jgi:hypothetical protein
VEVHYPKHPATCSGCAGSRDFVVVVLSNGVAHEVQKSELTIMEV